MTTTAEQKPIEGEIIENASQPVRTTSVGVHADGKKEITANLPATAPVLQNEFISMMERLASNKDVDLEKLKQLREMYNDEQDREALRLFNIDFARMKPELPRVIKQHNNTQTSSKYAKLEDINDTIEPILGRYGFGTSMTIIKQDETGVHIIVELIHTGGHIKSTPVYMPIDDKGMQGTKNKTLPHAVSSSIMYARRVGECALLNISTGDDRDGNQATDSIPEAVAEIIKEKIKEFEEDYTEKFLKYMKVESVDVILAKDTQKAFNALAAKKKKFDEDKAKKEEKK